MHNIALLYQRLERYEEANEYWIRLHLNEKKPKRSDPEGTKIYYITMLKYIANNYLRVDDLEQAIPYLEEVLMYSRSDTETLESLLWACREVGRLPDALKYARKLHEEDPENADFLFSYTTLLDIAGEKKEIIPLYRQAMAAHPNSDFLKERLYACLIEKALAIRLDMSEESRTLLEEAGRFGIDDPRLSYLEAYFLRKDGETARADLSFKKAVGSIDDHEVGFLIGKTFYEDGMEREAIEAFGDIVACDCLASDEYFEDAVHFLTGKDDRENAELLCDLAVREKAYHLYDISCLLLDCKRPVWAYRYSLELVENDLADDEDQFLHLLILNNIGDKQKTLQYADTLYIRAVELENYDDIDFYKSLKKQIKTRGRFKNQHDR